MSTNSAKTRNKVSSDGTHADNSDITSYCDHMFHWNVIEVKIKNHLNLFISTIGQVGKCPDGIDQDVCIVMAD